MVLCRGWGCFESLQQKGLGFGFRVISARLPNSPCNKGFMIWCLQRLETRDWLQPEEWSFDFPLNVIKSWFIVEN